MFIAEKWTALGTEECTTACAALGVTAVGVSDDGSQPRYICAGNTYGYRSGYKTAGVADCNTGGYMESTYACLCDYTKGFRFEWKAAPGLLSDRGVTID